MILQEKQHEYLNRDGLNLVYNKTITLIEALAGFMFYIRHLDRRILLVRSEPNAIYKPGDVKAIVGEGMPSKYNSMNRGNLYINFTIKFPEARSLSKQQLKVCIVLICLCCRGIVKNLVSMLALIYTCIVLLARKSKFEVDCSNQSFFVSCCLHFIDVEKLPLAALASGKYVCC